MIHLMRFRTLAGGSANRGVAGKPGAGSANSRVKLMTSVFLARPDLDEPCRFTG
jgi:hypothetical protein